jgi:hypothetical protein
MRSTLLVFAGLQLADILTTAAALHFGGREMNGMVLMLMQWGPIAGLILSKAIIAAIAYGAATTGHTRALRLANYIFSAIVLWNLGIVVRLAVA